MEGDAHRIKITYGYWCVGAGKRVFSWVSALTTSAAFREVRPWQFVRVRVVCDAGNPRVAAARALSSEIPIHSPVYHCTRAIVCAPALTRGSCCGIMRARAWGW